MLDPLTSLSLASNIVQLVDVGIKAVRTGCEIGKTGSKADHKHLAAIASATKELCSQLQQQTATSECQAREAEEQASISGAVDGLDSRDVAGGEIFVASLAQKTHNVAEDLALMLQGLKLETLSGTTPPSAKWQPATGRKRKRDVAATLVKSVWKDSDLQKLRRQLLELQQGLMFSLTVMESQRTSEVLSRLGNISKFEQKQREDHLKELEQTLPHTLHILDELQAEQPAENVYEQSLKSCLPNLITQARTVLACEHIQNSLGFVELHQREAGIVDAHANTFKWIFENPELGFTEWASDKDGIYWITGKPGSGKSTLMKYLVHHPTTSSLLNTWANGRDVVVAYHYFWNAGTHMQASQFGLLTTLLYHVVRQSPDVAIDLVPRRFHQPLRYGEHTWTLQELSTTLLSFAERGSADTCLCFFIDGLDECQDELLDLVELLERLSKCPSIKLCVSSRPWSVFNAHYDNKTDGQLEVHHLTRNDILIYITDRMTRHHWFKLLKDDDEGECFELIKEITDKAHGVFLWVGLVVRSLLHGLNNDDGIAELSARLREYPDTLDGYYKRMFDRIEKIYRHHSARILLVALTSKEAMGAFSPHCLNREIEDADYALRIAFNDSSATSEETRKLRRMPPPRQVFASRRYLDARCADLLEIVGRNICFIHRTARDFLRQAHMIQALAGRAGEDFDPVLSLARLALWRLKAGSTEGSAASVDAIVNNMLKLVQRVERRNLQSFCELLQDIERNSLEIFQANVGSDRGQGLNVDEQAPAAWAVSALLRRWEWIRPAHAESIATDRGTNEKGFRALFPDDDGELECQLPFDMGTPLSLKSDVWNSYRMS